jgi:AcrR family transcriptional regulator
LAEISSAARTPLKTLTALFPSKQQIFTTLMDEFAGKLERRLTRAMAQQSSGVARAAAAIESGLAIFVQHRALTKIFLVQSVGISAILEQHRLYLHERFVRIIQSYLEQAVQEGEIAPLDTQIAATVWLGAIHELVLRWVQTESFDLLAATPTVQAMLLRGGGGWGNNKLRRC